MEVAHDVAGDIERVLDVGHEAGKPLGTRASAAHRREQGLHLGLDVANPEVGALLDRRSTLRRIGVTAALRLIVGDVGDPFVVVAVDEHDGVEVAGVGRNLVETGDRALAVAGQPVLLEPGRRATPPPSPRPTGVGFDLRHPPVHRADGTVFGVDDDGELRISRSCVIPLAELEWRFTASGGPGGQHANRSNTRAEVRFDVSSSPSLLEVHRARLLERFGPVVRVVANDERSQLRNRELALDRLRAKLAEALRVERTRRPTAPTRGAKLRRLETKKRRADLKRSRRPPDD